MPGVNMTNNSDRTGRGTPITTRGTGRGGTCYSDVRMRNRSPNFYSHLDLRVSKVLPGGGGALISKADIENAFRMITIRPSCYHLLGVMYSHQFYFDKCLPLRCSQLCVIFEIFSCAIQLILNNR